MVTAPAAAAPLRTVDTTSPVLDERSLHLRNLVVDALASAKKGHVGPALSIIEILRVLYDDFLRYRPDDPSWVGRDRLVLSKGHGCLGLYAILADKGFFHPDELRTVFQPGSRLGGHPEAPLVPGVELSTGSLGHGLPVAVGMAKAMHILEQARRVVVVTGDGELDEGSMWEAAMSAAHHGLDNLSVFVDYNKMQSYGPLGQVVDLGDLAMKWRSFGFAVADVDGHDVTALKTIVERLPLEPGRPSAVLCHTTKGRGFRAAENNWEWHFRFGISDDEIAEMRHELLGGSAHA